MSPVPPVSICIPVYNGGRYVLDAVHSALNQRCDCDYEVVVCDNASTDDTLEKVRALSDPRLRVVACTEFISMSANWNRAAALAAGDRLLMLSADDALLPDALAHLMGAFNRHPGITVAYGAASHLKEGGEERLMGSPAAPAANGLLEDLEGFILGAAFPININACLFRRPALRFREDVGVVCDLELLLRLGREGHSACAVPDAVVSYRQHPGALSSNRERMWNESLHVFRLHAEDNLCLPLYRRRIFLTLMWLCAYLAERGEGAKASAAIRLHGSGLGLPARGALHLISRVPRALSLRGALRQRPSSPTPS